MSRHLCALLLVAVAAGIAAALVPVAGADHAETGARACPVAQELRTELEAQSRRARMPKSLLAAAASVDEQALADAAYLGVMFDRFRSAELALAAYRVGPRAVEDAFGTTPPAARRYVAAVMQRWKRNAGCA